MQNSRLQNGPPQINGWRHVATSTSVYGAVSKQQQYFCFSLHDKMDMWQERLTKGSTVSLSHGQCLTVGSPDVKIWATSSFTQKTDNPNELNHVKVNWSRKSRSRPAVCSCGPFCPAYCWLAPGRSAFPVSSPPAWLSIGPPASWTEVYSGIHWLVPKENGHKSQTAHSAGRIPNLFVFYRKCAEYS